MSTKDTIEAVKDALLFVALVVLIGGILELIHGLVSLGG